MKFSFLTRSLIILAIVFLNVGCDQMSKSVVRENLDYYEQIELWEDRVILTKVENTGAFLSMGSDFSSFWRQVLLIFLPAAVILTTLGFLFAQPQIHFGFVAGLCFIIGGGMGNLFDRVLFGSVTDFLHLDFYVVKTGIFNMADVSIMVGVFVTLILYYRRKGELHVA